MLVPVGSPVTTPSDNDHRDLLTSLRLLSGQDCKRDARQAQVLLVGLTESEHKDVAEDARSVMRAGLARGWFDETVPQFYELRNLAKASLENFEKKPGQKMQLILVAVGLLVMVMFGLVFFFRMGGGGLDIAIAPMIPLIAILVILGLVVYLKTKM